ncbi:MAG: 16S rRNA (cytosine(1402)-N(4))-methyltransferase RsmH [Bdellovibrionia bacterium]
MTTLHQPILVEPIVQALLEPFRRLPPDAPPHFILDCTLGGGGHSAALLNALACDPQCSRHGLLAVDQDQDAVDRAHQRFAEWIAQGKMEIRHGRFADAFDLFAGKRVLGLLADLGFSSDQLNLADRGLSFQSKGPLDMRLDPSQGESAQELLRRVSQNELERILEEFGEERFARRIAGAIVERRRLGELPTTTQALVEVIVRAIPPGARHGRIHVATRTFQALRIAVNQELEQLDQLLSRGLPQVVVGGRAAIISFHSLEDRRVKVYFKQESQFQSLTKKPIQPDEAEIRSNSRARSAKLRIAERVV